MVGPEWCSAAGQILGHLESLSTARCPVQSRSAQNWPIIGPHGVDGACIAAALSGFGSMSACAAGDLCAAWVTERILPEYAIDLSLARYNDKKLMTEIENASNKGIL